MNDDSMPEFPFDDELLFEEEDDDPVATAICQALYPVLSGVFARELAQALDE